MVRYFCNFRSTLLRAALTFTFYFFSKSCEEKKVGLCSRRWPEDNWCCLVAAVVVLIVVAVVGIASWHDAAAVFFGCVRQDVTHDTFIGTSWLRNYRQMWLSGYSALTLETSAPGLPGYYVKCSNIGKHLSGNRPVGIAPAWAISWQTLPGK